MNDALDKDFGKEIGKAFLLAVVSTAAAQMVMWVFEKFKDKKEEKEEK
jgi:hypothetical protein